MKVLKLIAYLVMFLIKEILDFKIYINNLFILIKKLRKPYEYFFKNEKLEIFSDKNLNSYIQLNSKIWENNTSSYTKIKKKVLIESLINHPQYLITNCIIGARLAIFYNLDCVGMIREGDLISEKIMKSFGIKEIIKIGYGNFFSRLCYFLKGIKILGLDKKTRDLINFKIDNIEIGKTAYESYVRYKKRNLTKKVNFTLFYFLSKILYSNYLINKILDKKKYVYLVQAEKQFVPFRIFFQNALKRKMIIYTRYGSGGNIAVRRYNNFNNVNSHRAGISKKIVKFYYTNFKKEILSNFKNNFRNVLINNIGSEVYQNLNINKNLLKNINNKEEICKLFGWKIEDPIVLIFSHLLVDGNFVNKWNLFNSNQEWLEETLKVINKTKNVNWIIKPHPSEEIYEAKINAKDIFNKIIDHKNNIKFFPTNFSIKNFYKFIDIIITSHGTVGYQYPQLGKTTIICGDTYYSGHGFNVEPKTQKKYFHLLRNIQKIKPIKKSQMEKSIVFSYAFNVVTKVKIPTIYNSDITMNYDEQKFWRESYKLLKKYTNKKNEKNFYKSLDFQFLNNNENLINLSKSNF